jgi:hypothetical protein
VQDDFDNHFEEGNGFKSVPDILRQAAFFELAGIGLPREEIVRISLALTELITQCPFIKVSFSRILKKKCENKSFSI